MALETGTYISDLVVANPTASDPKSQGDDHLRLIKSTLKTTFANVTGAVTPTHVEFNYMVGVTSAVQTQLNAKGAIAGQTWTGTHAFPSTTSIGTVTAAEIARLSGITGNIQSQIDGKGAITGQTWTGTHNFPSTVSFGNVSATEISYLDGVTSAIQTQMDLKAPLASPALTGVPTAPTAAVGTNTTQIATMAAIVAQAFLTALPAQAGNAGKFIKTDGATASWASVGVLDRRAIVGADTVAVADIGQLVDVTAGTFTLAFAAAATLGDQSTGWVQNSGTGNVTLDPNGAETIDGLTSFIMYPGELRRWYVEGATIKTQVMRPFFMKVTATATFTKPPGYGAFGVRLWSSGASGQRTNNGATAASGGGGGGCGETTIPATSVGTTETITIGAGGLAVSGVANGNPGNTTSFGALFSVYPGSTWLDGGSVRNALVATSPVGFEGAQNGNTPSITGAIWGGGAVSNTASAPSSPSIYGGGAGGSVDAGGTLFAAGTSLLGGAGGAASAAGNGTAGTAPGGGGGGTKTGASSGAGARGEAWVWGVA